MSIARITKLKKNVLAQKVHLRVKIQQFVDVLPHKLKHFRTFGCLCNPHRATSKDVFGVSHAITKQKANGSSLKARPINFDCYQIIFFFLRTTIAAATPPIIRSTATTTMITITAELLASTVKSASQEPLADSIAIV